MTTQTTHTKTDSKVTWEKIYDICIELQAKFPEHFTKAGSEPLWKYIWGNPTMFFHYDTIATYPGVLRNEWVFMDNSIKGLPPIPADIRKELYTWIDSKQDLGIRVFSRDYQ